MTHGPAAANAAQTRAQVSAAKPRVLIAGAGIGGLVLALGLLQRGYTVAVLEQAPELLEIGAGIQIAANGTRILRALGLEPALRPTVVEAAGKEVRLWDTGEHWKLFDLGEDSVRRFGAPYWLCHRGDLHRVLLDAVRAHAPDAVRAGARVLGFTQDADGVALHLAGGETVAGDLLVGADGVHSTVRGQMFGAQKAAFTGLMAWRCLAPADSLPDDLRRIVGTNWVGPGGHCITYPIRGGSILNFVGLVERPDWTRESWTEAGTVAECAADFVGWHPLIHTIIQATAVPYRWALVQRDPLAGWTQGRVTLLGDACHPTLPFLAQGACMAIEDGLILARCLHAFGPDHAGAFARYEALRAERTAAVVNGSKANVARFHNPVLARHDEAVQYIEREWAPDKVRQRYDWLFDYDAVTLPIR